jgi:threonyl-tRNA synthetase
MRVHVDARNEKMNAKIREHTLQKVPFLLVVGDKEVESGEVSVRTRGKGDEGHVKVAEFAARIGGLIAARASKIN